MLFGGVTPSGKLPITFPASLDQLPNAKQPGSGLPHTLMGRNDPPFNATYPEGAATGYRWYQERGLTPQYPFGYGLSYTRFGYGGLKTQAGRSLTVSFTVTHTGPRSRAEAAEGSAQPPGTAYRRLGGFTKAAVKPGGPRRVSVT